MKSFILTLLWAGVLFTTGVIVISTTYVLIIVGTEFVHERIIFVGLFVLGILAFFNAFLNPPSMRER